MIYGLFVTLFLYHTKPWPHFRWLFRGGGVFFPQSTRRSQHKNHVERRSHAFCISWREDSTVPTLSFRRLYVQRAVWYRWEGESLFNIFKKNVFILLICVLLESYRKMSTLECLFLVGLNRLLLRRRGCRSWARSPFASAPLCPPLLWWQINDYSAKLKPTTRPTASCYSKRSRKVTPLPNYNLFDLRVRSLLFKWR